MLPNNIQRLSCSSEDSSNKGIIILNDPEQRSKTIKVLKEKPQLFKKNKVKSNIDQRPKQSFKQNQSFNVDQLDHIMGSNQNSFSSVQSGTDNSGIGILGSKNSSQYNSLVLQNSIPVAVKAQSEDAQKHLLGHNIAEEFKQQFKSDRSNCSKKSKKHQKILKSKIKKNFDSIVEEDIKQENGVIAPQREIIDASQSNLNQLEMRQSDEENLVPDEQPPSFASLLTPYERNFRKQEIFGFTHRKGSPILHEMRPLSSPQKEWALSSVEDKDFCVTKNLEKVHHAEQQKTLHQQRVMGLLQDLEKNIDTIDLDRWRFSEDIKNFERRVVEERIYKIQQQKIQKKLEEEVEAACSVARKVSDSDFSFYDSDSPQIQQKRSIIQPQVSKEISMKMANKKQFLEGNQIVIQEEDEEIQDKEESLYISNRQDKDKEESVEIPERLVEIQEVQNFIKMVSAHIPSVQKQEQDESLIKLSEQLFQRNKQLEGEKNRIMEQIKKKVQTSGHLVLNKFSSFGNEERKLPDDGQQESIQDQILKLAAKIENSEISETLKNCFNPNTFKSVRLPQKRQSEKEQIRKAQSFHPNPVIQPSDKQEQFKALKETLEATKLNKDLLNYIQDKLNKLMIDFNLGFIISLSIQEKQQLKEMIDNIDQKNDEQIQNKQKVYGSSPELDYFKEAFNKIEKDTPEEDQSYHMLKEALQTDYSFYFQMKNGIFIAQAQMQYASKTSLKQFVNIMEIMLNMRNLETLRRRMKQEEKFERKNTLVIDLETVFLAKIDLKDEHDLSMLMGKNGKNFVFVRKNVQKMEECNDLFCSKKLIDGCCPCNLNVYNIRPYSFEIISALLPFYEMIASSNLPSNEILQIVNHFEKILNQPLEEKNWRTIEKIQQNGKKDKKDKIGRFKPIILKMKMYFQFMMGHRNFEFFDSITESLENLYCLTHNRENTNIFLLTSNQKRLVAAMDQGFCGIPVLKYQKFDNDDFQLRLIENYLIKHQYFIDAKSKNINDFGILTQQCSLRTSLLDSDGDQQESCFKRREEILIKSDEQCEQPQNSNSTVKFQRSKVIIEEEKVERRRSNSLENPSRRISPRRYKPQSLKGSFN